MKKFILIPMFLILFAVSASASASGSSGGFTGPSLAPITVQEARKLSDDTPVVLVGRIERALGDEKYLFRDDTGSVTVEIDSEDWRGLSVGPDDLIEIRGEVDRGFRKFKIDVDTVVRK